MTVHDDAAQAAQREAFVLENVDERKAFAGFRSADAVSFQQ
jgi:hypothetical protein